MLLFSACSNRNNPPEESESNTETAAQKISFTQWDTFIAPDPEIRPDDVEYYGSYNCVPGYIYFKKGVYGEIKPLLTKKLMVQRHIELYDKVYAVTEDREVVSLNKLDGSCKTVYTLQHGLCTDIDINTKEDLLYFNDGAYIVQLNTGDETFKIVAQSNNGVSKLVGGGGYSKVENFYYCDICGGGSEFFIWQDKDKNTFWYHPETGENEEIDWEKIFVGTPIG